MNVKRWAASAAAAFAVLWVTSFLIHHVWLSGFYHAHAAWWRPEAEMRAKFPLMILAQALSAILLALVYAKGYEAGKGGLAQGARFGLLIGELMVIPANLVAYVIYPYPASIVVSWILGGLAELVLAGAAIGAVYREGTS